MKNAPSVSSLVRIFTGSRFVSGQLSCLRRLLVPLCALGILTLTASADMTGQLKLVDSSGDEAATYQAGDKVYVKLTDSDGNADSAAVETIDVKITSDTEDTGDPFTASAVTADSGNTGDGPLEVLKTSYDTKTEDWTLMMINDESKTFKVTGSVSGVQNKQLSMRKKVNDWEWQDLTEVTYSSDGGEITLRLTQGTVSFAVGDEFTFSTTAGTVVGETLTLTETGADTGIFEGNIELATGSATAANSKLEVASGDRVTVF